MKTFQLLFEEFQVALGLVQASNVPGIKLTPVDVGQPMVGAVKARFLKKGYLQQAKDPNAFHLNDDLLDTVLTLAGPGQVVLVKDAAKKKSIQFAFTEKQIAMIVVTDQNVVISLLDSLEESADEIVRFLGPGKSGVIGIATVVNSDIAVTSKLKITQGKMAFKSGNLEFSTESITQFLKQSLVIRRKVDIGK